MRLAEFHREMWGLDRIAFRNQPPSPHDLPHVFAARDNELDRAVTTVFDVSRNVLIYGLFGIGKTVFIEALLRDLRENHADKVLCVSERLDGIDADVKTTILRGLVRELRHEDDEANKIYQLLAGVELTSQQINKISGSGEISIPTLFKAGGSGEESVTETWARKLIPNAAYQIRELIERAMRKRPDRRLVVAVDDLDKRDPGTVRANLADVRTTLHEDCSFIFTGHPLGILRQAYDTLGGAFDLQMELKVLSDASMSQLMNNYLEVGRRDDTPKRGLFPFTEEAAQVIIKRSFGIPRVLNTICQNILLEAGEMRSPLIDLDVLHHCWQKAGDKLRRAINSNLRNVLEILKQQQLDPEHASEEVFERFGVDSYADLIARLNAFMRDDLVIGIEKAGRSLFLPQPLLNPLTPDSEKTKDEEP